MHHRSPHSTSRCNVPRHYVYPVMQYISLVEFVDQPVMHTYLRVAEAVESTHHVQTPIGTSMPREHSASSARRALRLLVSHLSPSASSFTSHRDYASAEYYSADAPLPSLELIYRLPCACGSDLVLWRSRGPTPGRASPAPSPSCVITGGVVVEVSASSRRPISAPSPAASSGHPTFALQGL